VPFVWPRNKTSSEKKNGKKRVELKASADYERMLSLPDKAPVEKHRKRNFKSVATDDYEANSTEFSLFRNKIIEKFA
jgi:hypothetical protein